MNIAESLASTGFKGKKIDRRFCTAPLMDWSDKHCRMFWRTLSKEALLYTEMVTTGAILHGDQKRHLNFNPAEHPLALQLGGSVPSELAACSKQAEHWGYDEVNLNVGCPSDRVQNNKIGACLMAEPHLVADCIKAMQDACNIEVTVKHRIGIDHLQTYDHLHHFVETVANTGCKTFIVHARIALLQGLSPKENREIPPLRYDDVYRLKQDFPHLEIIINGGIASHEDAEQHLQHVDGVMLGRAAYQTPWLLSEVDTRYFNASLNPVTERLEAIQTLIPYIEQQLSQGAYLHHMLRHILGLFHGMPSGRLFRRTISEHATQKGAGLEVLNNALNVLTEQSLNQP